MKIPIPSVLVLSACAAALAAPITAMKPHRFRAPAPSPGRPPTVQLTGALDQSVGGDEAIGLRFSQPMDLRSRAAFTWSPPVHGTWRWIAPDRLTFRPTGAWPEGTETLTLNASLAATRQGAHPRANLRFRLATSPEIPVLWFVNHSPDTVYLTIDDGWFPNTTVLEAVQKGLPLTTFLIEDAAAEHLAFWKAFRAAGGVIEDHTVSHPFLTSLTAAAAKAQIGGPIGAYAKWFGTVPILLRPPYGAYNPKVEQAAEAAGIRALVMWSAVDQNGVISTWNRKPLTGGEIIILHWLPGVGRELESLLRTIRARHLRVGALLPALASTPGAAAAR